MKSPAENLTTVQVELESRSYPIYIGQQLTAAIPHWIQQRFPAARHAVLIVDSHLGKLATDIDQGLQSVGFRCGMAHVPSGEASKSVELAQQLWQYLLSEHTDRGSIVVAIGGGVVGDLSGFVAATFARGLPFVQVPTTLLSQVDSSVGGKTGINLPGAKNIVGAFWQPALVAIDIRSLDSLPERQFLSGLAEVAKYGVILLPEFFAFLEQHAAELKS